MLVQENGGVDSFRIRDLTASDIPPVSPLLDAALGVGFWDAGDLACEVALVAEADGARIGVGAACLDRTDDHVVGHIRLVAVDPAWRRRGVATSLVRGLVTRCEELGATEHLTYAWVHGAKGIAPMAGVLVGTGFVLSRRIEGFYSGIIGGPCPACGESPCVCPADLYLREARVGSQQAHPADGERYNRPEAHGRG
jgi:GNAT superfamily N-acetyltransferase